MKPFGASSHQLRRTVGTNILGTLQLDTMSMQCVLNHTVVSGSDTSYLDVSEQFIDRKKKTLTLWHKRLNELKAAHIKTNNTGNKM